MSYSSLVSENQIKSVFFSPHYRAIGLIIHQQIRKHKTCIQSPSVSPSLLVPPPSSFIHIYTYTFSLLSVDEIYLLRKCKTKFIDYFLVYIAKTYLNENSICGAVTLVGSRLDLNPGCGCERNRIHCRPNEGTTYKDVGRVRGTGKRC